MSDPRIPADYTKEIMNMEDPFCSMTEVTTTTTKRQKSKNKRRFSDDQIRLLESIFESESRLDRRKKYQVAKDLGLQPRQVGIWFQNKRARTKSKELERDYNILQDNYNDLASMFEGLKKEKQALVSQLQKLNDLLKKPKDNKGEAERSGHLPGVLSDDDSAIVTGYFGLEEEPQLMSMVEAGDGALASPEDWHGFESDALFDQSGCAYQWCDFWS